MNDKELIRKEVELKVLIDLLKKVQHSKLDKVKDDLEEALAFLQGTNDNIAAVIAMNKELKEGKSYLDEERYNIAIDSNVKLLLELETCKEELLKIIDRLTPKAS